MVSAADHIILAWNYIVFLADHVNDCNETQKNMPSRLLNEILLHHLNECEFSFRLRVGRPPPDRAPCQSRATPLEETIRRYADKPLENVVKPEIGMSFDSLGEAYDFYNLYSWELGFGIRYGKSRLNVEQTKCMQEIVCGCSGKPEQQNSRSCQCECPAMIRLLRAANYGWYIAEYHSSHNQFIFSDLW
ncbi:protein FAR1-RELATED SEQUENCE 7-like [Triticum urartu]|uniref:protein FAR1-RELATED SEQUENCE 7-like n=1 Tax=Triticum urartu TaxID=4572 RepID=UPI00204454EB|nr:protein FAR1-RELATED SEQUENCE 7-like [Triticum urartu]